MQDYWVWLNGKIVPPSDAHVSVFDHGFLYGDSIYETLRTVNGRLFAADDHLDRLDQSAAAIGLRIPSGRNDLKELLRRMAAAKPVGASEAALRLVVTRGIGPISLDPELCAQGGIIAYGWPLHAGRHPAFSRGISAAIAHVRRNHPAALDPRIKSGNFLNNILAFAEAKRAGAEEAILLSMEGNVAEGTTSNVFWVRRGKLFTPGEEGILSGVTRKHLMKICEREKLPHESGRFLSSELAEADEVFITSTLRFVLPVTTLDGRRVGEGKPGPLTERVASLYERELGQYLAD